MRRSTLFAQFAGVADAPLPFQPLGAARVVAAQDGSLRLRSGTTTVEVTALAHDVFRVGMFGEGRPVDYRSAAVDFSDWPATPTRFRQTGAGASLEAGTF